LTISNAYTRLKAILLTAAFARQGTIPRQNDEREEAKPNNKGLELSILTNSPHLAVFATKERETDK
jgi:hypothetical protein